MTMLREVPSWIWLLLLAGAASLTVVVADPATASAHLETTAAAEVFVAQTTDDPAPAPTPPPIPSPSPGSPNDDPADDSEPISDRNLLGFEQYGEYPLGHYSIGCDEGAWNHLSRKFWCVAQSFPFEITKSLVGLANSTVTWALNFEIAESLISLSAQLSTAYDLNVVGPLQLKHLAWMVACAWVGWLIIRSRTSQALGELATSILAAGLGAFLIANPAGYLTGFVETVQDSSTMILESVTGSGAAGGSAADGGIAGEIGYQLETAFVAAPYDLINWGRPLDGVCADTRNLILAEGEFGNSDTPRVAMVATGCEAEADFNHNPSAQRAMASLVIMFGAGLLMLLMLLLAVSLLVSQFLLVIVWGVLPIVLTLAIAPGPGRQLAYRWFGSNVLVLMVTIAATLTLAFVTSISTFLLSSATSQFTVLQRLMLVDVMVIAGFVFRKRLMRIADAASSGAAGWLDRTMPARTGSGAWVAAGSGAALTGVALSQRFRSTADDVPGGHAVVRKTDQMRHRAGQRATGWVHRGRRRRGTAQVVTTTRREQRGLRRNARGRG